MQLSKKILAEIKEEVKSIPGERIFELPEKVLQFGTGVLLRGLPDYYIDKANKRGIFNGRIVMVKSTEVGHAYAYAEQDGLYTQCLRGVRNEEVQEEYIINASISRVLSANKEWKEILKCVRNPNLELVISNTTEVGIVLAENDDIAGEPPVSFPGKLLALLYERYKAFHGDLAKGLVIVPTELITDNGSKLQSIVMELAHINKFDYAFIDWLDQANQFCNSLVDRIVPGKLPPEQHRQVEVKLGYEDQLMIMSEPYGLWAIESSSPKVRSVLNFANADDAVVITPDINKHRELKLRLLNGTHSCSCGLAHLAGFETVKQAMENEEMGLFVYDLMLHEIAPCIVSADLTMLEAVQFSHTVIDRFRNPFIEHRWINITMQYTHKMRMRNVPVLQKHYHHDLYVPEYMAMGFAAYLLFMKCEQGESGKFYGHANNLAYPIQDDQAGYFFNLWKENNLSGVVKKSLANEGLWGVDLTTLPGFAYAVELNLESIIHLGAMGALKEFLLKQSRLEGQEA